MIQPRGKAASTLALVMIVFAFTGSARAAEPVTGWQETGVRSFYGIESFYKTQGIASDGNKLYFSWNVGLHSTDLAMDRMITDNTYNAIPQPLQALGLTHIGDIDYFEGKIYAPIEGKPSYEHSTIVTYDPETLKPTGEQHELQRDPYLPDGAPWVAIDPVRRVAYTGKWNNTDQLNVHRLSDFEIISTIPLSRPLPRIQGAKVFKGMLYAARDNGPEKSIEAVDLDTGEVTNLFDRNLGEHNETEGIAFVVNSSGTTMMTSDIDESDRSRVDVHSYRVGGDTTPPRILSMKLARNKLKPGKRIKALIESSEAVSTIAFWSRCVGGKKKPCAKTKTVGSAPVKTLKAGRNDLVLDPRGESWAPGKRFNPGRYRLNISPTDQADAVGPTAGVNLAVVKPKKPKRRKSGK